MVKEYSKDLFRRALTALAMILPIILIIYFENFWLFSLTISVICLFAYYEWIKNEFRRPLLWGFNLIFGYFWLLIILIAGDFNIISEEIDVYDFKRYENDALGRLEIRKKFRELINLGFKDTYRLINKKKTRIYFLGLFCRFVGKK